MTRTTVIGCALFLLAGCVGDDMADLQQYVDTTLTRPGPPIEALPEPQHHPRKEYEAAGGRDPFKPFFPKSAGPKPGVQSPVLCEGPDEDRLKEELESYPLDSLRMVGTIRRDEELYGVVQSSEGAIHRVAVDNFLGHNHGRLVEIREAALKVIEIVPDAQGCLQERVATLALVE